MEVIAIQKTVVGGSTVQVELRNSTGGRILGNLQLSGPGTFIGSGNPMRFDAWGTAHALVQTSNPGAITLTFVPDENAGAAGVEEMFK